MSAWPEAVWIVREINAALTADEKIQQLSKRLDALQHRHIYIGSDQAVITEVSDGAVFLKYVN